MHIRLANVQAVTRYHAKSLIEDTFLPRDAMLAWHKLSCICLSISPFVTLQYCIKTDERMIMLTRPYDSPGTLII